MTVCMQPGVDFEYLFQLPSSLCIESRSLPEVTISTSLTGQLAPGSPVSVPSAGVAWSHYALLTFSVDAGDMNASPHAYVASSLVSEPS